MRSMVRRLMGWSALALVVLISVSLDVAQANGAEVHNFIEPPFGQFSQLNGLAVDQSNGNVYAGELARGREVMVFGREGGTPAGGGPSSFTGTGSFSKSFNPIGAAVDPTHGYIYVADLSHQVVDRYALNASNEYEYLCEFKYYGVGNRCLPNGGEEKESTTPEGTKFVGFEEEGVAVDSIGDVYVGGYFGYKEGAVFEFNAAGEALHIFLLPAENGAAVVRALSVASNGTIYTLVSAGPPYIREVLELRRSSPTGTVEGEPIVLPHTETGYFSAEAVQGLAFDRANGQLFLAFASSAEALNGAHEVLSRFGAGVISKGKALAVDEATGEIYVANGAEHDIDRFGPVVQGTLPAVDEPPPSLSDVTRTSALLSGAVSTGDATTRWLVEYVAAGEYQPAAPNPYAGGGSTALSKLAPVVGGTSVGPLPLTGLLAGTTYHYRLVASNELGTTYGPDHAFTTSPATPPIVTTGAASEVTQTGVLLTGTVNTQELQTSYEFEVGTDTSYKGAKLFGNAGNAGTEAVSASLLFLIPGTTYHYRLVASNEDGTTYGQDVTFTTPPVPAPITQPTALAFVPTPTGAFPSVAGAITKPHGSHKATGKKRKRRRVRARARHRRRRR